MYPEFQYFLEAYCTLSMHREELPQAIEQFCESECAEEKEKLLKELLHIQNDREGAATLMRETGQRELSAMELHDFIHSFIVQLQKEKA